MKRVLHDLHELGALLCSLAVFAYWFLYLMWKTDPSTDEDQKS